MRVHIHATNVEITTLLKKMIEKRTHYLFSELGRDVRSVNIRLLDQAEGDREARAFCSIQIQTRGLPIIYAEHKSDDAYFAFNAAAHQAKKHTSRRLNKLNQLLTRLKNLKTKKIRTKTLRINKPQQLALGGSL